MRPSLTRVTRAVRPDRHDIIVYTDGACKGNPGPGGWGCIGFKGEIEFDNIQFKRSGGAVSTTNNRMELNAVVEALSELANPAYLDDDKKLPTLLIVVDAEYVLKGVTEWAEGWIRRGWKKADQTPVVNADLWKKLLALLENFDQITWCKVKGHSNDYGNDMADKLASDAAIEIRQSAPVPA